MALELRALLRKAREPLVFGIVGVASTLTYLAVSLLCAAALDGRAMLSSLIGHSVATLVSFFGHHRLTFRRTGRYGHYGTRFFVLMIINYLLNAAIIQGVVHWLGYPAQAGFVAVALIVPGISYLISKFWVFHQA